MESHLAWSNIIAPQANRDRLPDDLRSAALNHPLPRRRRYLQSRLLLAEMMYQLYGCERLPPIAIASNGRPCFADPALPDFNVSYAGNVVAIMLSHTGRVGVDIEFVRVNQNSKYAQLQLQFLTAAEHLWLRGQYDPSEAIAQLWTIRESVLKISGLGKNGFHTLQLQPSSGKIRSSVTPSVQSICHVTGGIAWACSQSPALGDIHFWKMRDSGTLENVKKQTERELKHSASCLRFSNSISHYQENI